PKTRNRLGTVPSLGPFLIKREKDYSNAHGISRGELFNSCCIVAEPPVRADILPLARFGMQARESLRCARPPCGSLSPFADLIEPILLGHVFFAYGQAES